MLSPHAKSEWMTITIIGILLSATAVLAGLWWLSIPILIFTICLVLFFRDPDRPIPTQRGIMVAPADGKVSSIHEVEFFEPFNGPATCVRIFLSVFDVHINRSPIHGVVTSVTHKPGQHLNVLNPESAEVNEYNMIIMAHPVRRDVIAAVRQVAGLCARTICCTVGTGSVVQRGQRIGIIKLGSTTELYIPARFSPQVVVEQGQYVYGGSTILANINLGPAREGEEDEDGTTPLPTPITEPTDLDSESNTDTVSEAVEETTITAAAVVAAEQVVTDVPVAETPETVTLDSVALDEEVIVEDEADADATDAMDAIEDEDAKETAEEASDEDSNEQEDYVEEPDAEELDTFVDEVEDDQDETEDEELTEAEDEETSEDEADEEESEEDEDADSEVDSDVEDESEEDQDTSDDDDVTDDDDDDDEIESDTEAQEEEPKDQPKGKPGKKKSEDDDSPMLF